MTSWTDDKVETLKRLHAAGEPFSAIARHCRVTRNAAIGKAQRLGLETRGRNPPMKPPPKLRFPKPPVRDVAGRRNDERDLRILDALVAGERPADVALSFHVMPEHVRDLWDAREAAG